MTPFPFKNALTNVSINYYISLGWHSDSRGHAAHLGESNIITFIKDLNQGYIRENHSFTKPASRFSVLRGGEWTCHEYSPVMLWSILSKSASSWSKRNFSLIDGPKSVFTGLFMDCEHTVTFVTICKNVYVGQTFSQVREGKVQLSLIALIMAEFNLDVPVPRPFYCACWLTSLLGHFHWTEHLITYTCAFPAQSIACCEIGLS